MTTERDQAQSVTPLPLVNPGVPDSSDTSAQAPAEASSFEDQIAALKAENEKLQGQVLEGTVGSNLNATD